MGGTEDDVKVIVAHPFFKSINWQDLVEKKIQPPWKPDVKSSWDTKYIPDEFAREITFLTPPGQEHLSESMRHELDSIDEEGELPYFEQFSFHGNSSKSFGGYLSESVRHTDELF